MRIPLIVVIAVLVFLAARYGFSRKLIYFPVKVDPEHLARVMGRLPEALVR